MKVLFNPAIRTRRQEAVARNTQPDNPVVSEQSVQKLPSYNQVDKSMLIQPLNFKAGYSSVTNAKYVKEMNLLQEELKTLSGEKIDESVTNAKKLLKKLADWYDYSASDYSGKVWDRAYSIAVEAGNAAKNAYAGGKSRWWKFWNGDGTSQYNAEYDKKMRIHYYDKKYEVEDIQSKKSLYESIVKNGDKSEAQRFNRMSEIRKQIETLQKLINYQSLQDSISEMLGAHGGIKERIAGYNREKSEINAKFVDLLAKSRQDASAEVPSAVILYGPTGTGKTTFLNGIKDQSKDYATCVKLSGLSAMSLLGAMSGEIEEARNRYTKENKRTIFLLDDAEKYFAIKPEDAPILGVTLDANDKNMLEAYGNNYELVSHFKQLLDNLAKTPDETNLKDGACASTVFITTNYPHLIHPDILSREGKASKIAIGLASEDNLREVLRHYFSKMEGVAEKLRTLKGKPDADVYLDSVAGITEKGRTVLKQMVKDGTIDTLHVDTRNMPYEQLMRGMGPNTTKGAYSNDRIRVICQEAFLDYLENANDDGDYKDSFFKVFVNTKRDINPERLKKFNLIDRMLKDETFDTETLEALLQQRDLGLLSEKKANLLKYHLVKLTKELESLKEYEIAGTITKEQEAKKAELEVLVEKIKNPEAKADDVNATDFE